MKKFKGNRHKGKQFFLILIIVFFAASCGTTGDVETVFDDSIPVEKTAGIITWIGSVTAYNGIPVDWKRTFSRRAVQIPAGEATLEWDIDSYQGFIRYTGKGMLMKYNFKPQKKYLFQVEKKENVTGLAIYEYDKDEKVKYSYSDMDTHKVDFVPFLNTGRAVLQ
jgi:hypothetical protein